MKKRLLVISISALTVTMNCLAGFQEGISDLYRIDLLPRYWENTITVVLKENPEAGKGSFVLNRIYLEKI